jgi:hypothetical protein
MSLLGAVEESCCAYEATDQKGNTAYTECHSCIAGVCKPIVDPPRFYADYFGPVIGEVDMMSEIYSNGPIICRLRATERLLQYSEGVLRPSDTDRYINRSHAIAVVGWGVEILNSTTSPNGYTRKSVNRYWILRNTWVRGTGVLCCRNIINILTPIVW